MKTRKEKLPIQTRNLNVIPESINEVDRTVDVIFTTGATIKRYSWSGESYNEKLEVSNKAINFERLNAGAAILDSHQSSGVDALLGAIVQDSGRIENGKGIITARFLKDDEVADKVWNKIRQGFLRFFSVGYSVEKYIETLVDGVRTLTAVSWTPLEISIVTVPADAGAVIRANSDYSECEITYYDYSGLNNGKVILLREQLAADVAYFFHFSATEVMDMSLDDLVWWVKQGNRIVEEQKKQLKKY
ncbi:MAG: HK97 family phage prohead protease [Deltaproteobacteria bacterium]|jgi:HK97 family phage prohead protease|nr:HK97 family phage prohead protease [Deltaproteobacteria bacterium]